MILIIFSLHRLKVVETALETLALTILVSAGIWGVVPFVLREFLNINYYHSSFWVLALCFASSLIIFFLSKTKRENQSSLRREESNDAVSKITETILLFFLIILGIKGLLTPIQGWDAYSLYDSRAKIFLTNLKLADFKQFSQYDNFNALYYFSYPPMTSVIHTILYVNGVRDPMFIYALFYAGFAIFGYLILKRLALKNIYFISFIILALLNRNIISQTDIAYTNLPMLAFQIGSLYYLLRYIRSNNILLLIISALLTSFSIWTRSLEPIFIGFIIAAAYLIFTRKNNSSLQKLLLLFCYTIVSIPLKLLWSWYISITIKTLEGTTPNLLEIISRLPNALYVANILEILIFITSALYIIKYYLLLAVLAIIIHLNFKKNSIYWAEGMVILIILATVFSIMFFGTLYFSQTFIWWDAIPGSFFRSNLLLIPLIVFYIAVIMKGFLQDEKREKIRQ